MAESWLKSEICFVCYSDIVFSPNAVRALAESIAPLAITSCSGYWELWEKRMGNPRESRGWIEKTIRGPLAKPLNKLDMTTLLQEFLQRNYPIQAISTDDLWLKCDAVQRAETRKGREKISNY